MHSEKNSVMAEDSKISKVFEENDITKVSFTNISVKDDSKANE